MDEQILVILTTNLSSSNYNNAFVFFHHSDCHGVLHAWGENEFDFGLALGYAHARDRGMQLYFTRVVAEGRLSELFMPTPESIGARSYTLMGGQ